MTLKTYFILMTITTLVCWGIFGLVVRTTDPFVTNLIGFFLFYTSLFLALTGTGAISGFLIRFVALKRELVFRLVKTSFRQSFLFAFLIVAILYLNAHNLFTWLNLLLLIVALTILEYFLISYATTDRDG